MSRSSHSIPAHSKVAVAEPRRLLWRKYRVSLVAVVHLRHCTSERSCQGSGRDLALRFDGAHQDEVITQALVLAKVNGAAGASDKAPAWTA